MNEIVNTFLIAGDKIMLQMHLRSLRDLHIVLVDRLQKNKKRTQKFKETGD